MFLISLLRAAYRGFQFVAAADDPAVSRIAERPVALAQRLVLRFFGRPQDRARHEEGAEHEPGTYGE